MSYDIIVVGARCAGSTTAMLLARAGLSVLLVDKASFPSDALSTHYIHQPGVASLKRWGLLDRVLATGVPPVERQVFDVGPFVLEGTPPRADGVTFGIAPRRTVLDKILVDAAVEAGVELRERFSVKELLTDGERVTGVRGRSEGGALVGDHASFVIGADGSRSIIARLAGASSYDEVPAHSCAYYTYWSGVPLDAVQLCPRPERMLIGAPTNDGLTLTIGYWPAKDFEMVRADIERHFLEALDLAPLLAERVHAGTREEKFRGSAELAGFFRRPFGPGWALVGDAGYHKNPITAEGITDAFRDADLLADAIVAAVRGSSTEGEALAGYEKARNAAAGALYGLTEDLAKLEPPTEDMQQLMGALRGNEIQTGRFIGTIAGTVPIPEFFSPANITSIMAEASA